MNESHLTPLLLGTALCLGGWARFPARSVDLLTPRFVAPAFLWCTIFAQAMHEYTDTWQKRIDLRDAHATTALYFVCACLAMFWLGWLLPVGPRLARTLPSFSGTAEGSSSRLLVAALAISGVTVGAFYGNIALAGGEGIGGGRGIILTTILSMAGAVLVGCSWGATPRVSLAHLALGIIALFGLTVPWMAKFSRGVGIPVLLAVLAQCCLAGRIRWRAAIVAVVWVVVGAYAGWEGRGVHGHYAGVFAFLTHLTTGMTADREALYGVFVRAQDSLTPLCVCIDAYPMRDAGQLAPLDWFLLAIPLPQFVGLPGWTVSLQDYLGGGPGYTTSIFGDLYCHFGFWGCSGFVVLGAAYRFVDVLAFRRALPVGRVNYYVAFAMGSYFALALATFNNFRSWWSMFAYLLYLVLAIRAARALLGVREIHYTPRDMRMPPKQTIAARSRRPLRV